MASQDSSCVVQLGHYETVDNDKLGIFFLCPWKIFTVSSLKRSFHCPSSWALDHCTYQLCVGIFFSTSGGQEITFAWDLCSTGGSLKGLLVKDFFTTMYVDCKKGKRCKKREEVCQGLYDEKYKWS